MTDVTSPARGPWVWLLATACAVGGATTIGWWGERALTDVEAPDASIAPLGPDAVPFEDLVVKGRSGSPSDVALPGIPPPDDLSAGVEPLEGATGVVVHDAARTAPGRTLLVSGHASEAVLIDADGAVVRTWSVPFADVFPGWSGATDPGMAHLRSALRLPDGDLVVSWEGIGLARLATDGSVRWRQANGSTHALRLAPRGGLWGLTRRARKLPWLGDVTLWDEVVVAMDLDGNEKRRNALLAKDVHTPGAERLQQAAAAGGYALHASDLALAGPTVREPIQSGDVVVALRGADLLAGVRTQSGRVRWTLPGQGHPRAVELLPDGDVLLLVDDGIVQVRDAERIWHWPGPEGAPLTTTGPCGSLQRLDNGNTLVTDPPTGRALEVAPDGTVVWEWRSPWRSASDPERVATLLQATRVPE